MTAQTLLVIVVIIESILLMDALVVFLGHGLWLTWRRRRSSARVAEARAAVAAAIEDAIPSEEQLRPLRSLATRWQIRLLVEAARNMSGERRERLCALARELGLVDGARAWCRSRLWWRRLHGARLLTALGDGEAAMLALLEDLHPVVRAQAAEWAADHPAPGVIDALLNHLDDDSGLTRFTARDSLLRMGDAVIAPLISYLSRHTGRRVEAAMEVAAGLADPRLLSPALAACRNRLPRARALAAVLLGAIGGREGAGVLMVLLADPAPGVRAAAAQALGRLGYWPAAPRLAPLLRDLAWSVRREAGLALRALGAPGVLYLRRLLSDDDPFAVDMARQILDLPDVVWQPASPSP